MARNEYTGFGIMKLDSSMSFKLPFNMEEARRNRTGSVEGRIYYGARLVDFPHIILLDSPKLGLYNQEGFPCSREIKENGKVCLPEDILDLISNPGKVMLVGYSDHIRLWNAETFRRRLELTRETA